MNPPAREPEPNGHKHDKDNQVDYRHGGTVDQLVRNETRKM